MFINYRTQGFILKKINRGEADQLLTIYTRDFGRLEILARAIRKISSKLRSGAEIFYLSEIEFIQAKTHKTLTDAILIDKFDNVRSDLRKLKISHQIAEVFDKLVKGQEPDEKLWHLLKETFSRLNNWKTENLAPPPFDSSRKVSGETKSFNFDTRTKGEGVNKLEIIYYYFFWNLFSLLGYQPQLYHCALCQKKLVPEKLFFSPKEGGVICHQCQKSVESVRGATAETVKILRVLLKKDWPLLSKLKIEKPDLKSLDTVTSEYYSYICGQAGH